MLLLTLFSLFAAPSHAQNTYGIDNNFEVVSEPSTLQFYGRGIVDRKTNANLTLACLTSDCSNLRWVVQLAPTEAYYLGGIIRSAKTNTNPTDICNALTNTYNQTIAENMVSFNDESNRNIVRHYVAGFAKEATRQNRNDKPGFWYSVLNADKAKYGVVIYEYTDCEEGNTLLQKVGDREGWNWSASPQTTSHSYFAMVGRHVIRQALVAGEYRNPGVLSLNQSISLIRSNPNPSYSHQKEILEVLGKMQAFNDQF